MSKPSEFAGHTPDTNAFLGALAAERTPFDRLVDHARALEAKRYDLTERVRVLTVALETCQQYVSMPASGQEAHPISEAEFRARLLETGRVICAALAGDQP